MAITRRGPAGADHVRTLPTLPVPRERTLAAWSRRAESQQAEPDRVPLADVRCFVVDGSPAYRSGLRAALLEAGLVAEALAHVALLPGQVAAGGVALVHTMSSVSTPCPVLPFEAGVLVTVGLLPSDAPGDYAEALRHGWDAAVYRDAPLAEIVVVVREAVENRTVLPAAVAHELATRSHDDPHGLSEEQVAWVRFLADGGTIAALAQRFAYSEREMHRRLNVLYRRLGTANKVEALLEASKRGLV